MLIDLGMGVRHRNVRYNARVLCTYRKIFCIRPKMALANDGLYREARHFTAWSKQRQVETYYLEGVARKVTGQRSVPIGDMILSTPDTAVACESCEEMFVPLNPSIFTGLNGVSNYPELNGPFVKGNADRESIGRNYSQFQCFAW